ncbi:hypothetical protein HH310_21635 [Actinoplanes sp. TBRC 11911]|uniref:endonuclease/exonuclease/phosphatase family protein n=1 Tax=Actinoplanes sp. TBRC 11911 TaxID=2729386 RepID=UPI00145F92BC|nr:endonuclease/exonuclease/phosphatase family protein [Actinoplanes sp. TBRC 11911]NMO53772.1 hypothetical protein [Actinoplanes sp. TBRC 11911]
MPVLKSRLLRVSVSAAAVAATCGLLVGAAYASQSDTSAAGGFVIDALSAAQVPPGGVVSQPVRGLWSGDQPSGFAKVSGPDWLSVTAEGVVTGTVPADAPNQPVVVTVRAGSASVKVVVPVASAPRLEVASLNLDDAGANAASDARQKVLQAVAADGIQVLGVQESGGSEATELANDLGWHSWQSAGDLGIVSAYPISDVTAPTASVPAVAVTLDVSGQPVRVWVTHLDESDYGPARACAGATDVVAHEQGTTRYAQAQATASAMGADIAGGAPVILLGDLASPSGLDWTSAASHCGAGAVAWPVTAAFANAGLIDSFRTAHPDPVADAGPTWPSVAGDSTAGPADRVDYVEYAGGLTVLGAESYYTGWTGPGGPSTDWPSDHAAAVTLFQLPASTPATTQPSSTPATPPATSVPQKQFTSTPKPKITGTAKHGQTLTATAAAWSPKASLTYQWYADGTAIKNATTASYTIAAKYEGARLTVSVTGSKSGYATVTVTSAETGVVK